MGYKVHTVDGRAGEVDTSTARTYSKEVRVASGTAGTYQLCKVPAGAAVIAVRAYRTGGSAGTVQVKKNTSDILAAPMATATDAWAGSTTVQNAACAAGDNLSVVLAAPGGSPTEILVQVDLRTAVPA
ncbi:hypothetical protein GCM10011583_11960 [Streptomyces camponoticapitis]|uniref:CBM6 domain-containing protein n=1 Tax=Streptomyces camponoticapitis TaxID=1616125 RepID=A0ABQ2DZH9_9ACTN|nr:hypothetical protein [Streptomyces camponoticapitis]GGJ82026.1 hypothetical protein GCM10011583_11960 [Streptomyces camponoticapitis]